MNASKHAAWAAASISSWVARGTARRGVPARPTDVARAARLGAGRPGGALGGPLTVAHSRADQAATLDAARRKARRPVAVGHQEGRLASPSRFASTRP